MQVLSHTQAHDVLVPWQHEVVSDKGAAAAVGNGEETVDVEEGAECSGPNKSSLS